MRSTSSLVYLLCCGMENQVFGKDYGDYMLELWHNASQIYSLPVSNSCCTGFLPRSRKTRP